MTDLLWDARLNLAEHLCPQVLAGPASIKLSTLIVASFAIALALPTIRKVHVMSKRGNAANNLFRPSDSPLTEYEKEQKALRKNLERLKTERLAREAANSNNN